MYFMCVSHPTKLRDLTTLGALLFVAIDKSKNRWYNTSNHERKYVHDMHEMNPQEFAALGGSFWVICRT